MGTGRVGTKTPGKVGPVSKETQPRTLGTITEAAKNRGTFSGSVDKQVAIGSDEDVP